MQEYVNYGIYRLSIKEEIKCAGVALGLAGIAAWLLYKSPWGILLGVIIFPIYRNRYRYTQIENRKKELLLQFKDGMQSVAVALGAGFSVESAWLEGQKELRDLYGEEAYMVKEMKQMNAKIHMNQPVEQVLYQFALRSECEDIKGFAEVFQFAKRSGGDFGKIIQNTVRHITEKMEVEREIETVLSGKKMEQKIMNVVPVGLLAYLNLTSEEFFAPLYGNLFGKCVMTTAFVAYIGALTLAQKMVDIKV